MNNMRVKLIKNIEHVNNREPKQMKPRHIQQEEGLLRIRYT